MSPWRLNLLTNRGREEKLGCGVVDSPKTHIQFCKKIKFLLLPPTIFLHIKKFQMFWGHQSLFQMLKFYLLENKFLKESSTPQPTIGNGQLSVAIT